MVGIGFRRWGGRVLILEEGSMMGVRFRRRMGMQIKITYRFISV